MALLTKFIQFWKDVYAEPMPPSASRTTESAVVTQLPAEPPSSAQTEQTEPHIAAILAAIQEFTGLPLGTFQIDTIEALEKRMLTSAQIAAMTAAIHEFTSLPVEAFRIIGIQPLGMPNAWKMAGRLERMGID